MLPDRGTRPATIQRPGGLPRPEHQGPDDKTHAGGRHHGLEDDVGAAGPQTLLEEAHETHDAAHRAEQGDDVARGAPTGAGDGAEQGAAHRRHEPDGEQGPRPPPPARVLATMDEQAQHRRRRGQTAGEGQRGHWPSCRRRSQAQTQHRYGGSNAEVVPVHVPEGTAS